MRVHVIGGPGSGKTTLGKSVAERFRIPYLDLDDIFWDNTRGTYGYENPKEIRYAKLEEFIKKNGQWVIEGVYDKWLFPSFSTADIVIILRPSLWLRQFSIVQRFLYRKLGMQKGKHETLQNLRELLAWSVKYENVNLPRVIKTLSDNKIRHVICKNTQDVEKAMILYHGKV